VDKGANQPSVFPDPKSVESGLPYFSDGARDDYMQRRFHEAVLGAFDPDFGASDTMNPISPVYGERMVEPRAINLWTWDSRPYPVFPVALDVWSDGTNWETGHWLTGRLGAAPLDGLVKTILSDAGIANVAVGPLGAGPDGYLIDRPMSPRAALEPVTLAYAIGAAEDGANLRFFPRGGEPVLTLTEDDLVLPDSGAPYRLVRAQETELPNEVTLTFADPLADYNSAAVSSRRLVGGSSRVSHADLAVITSDADAERRAEIWLQDSWAGRESAEFALPASRLALAPGDIVALTAGGRQRVLEIGETSDTGYRQIKARSINPDAFNVPMTALRQRAPAIPVPVGPAHAVTLDLPMLTDVDPRILTRIAVMADPWPGAEAVWRSGDGLSYERAVLAVAPATVGETLDPLPRGPTSRFDYASNVRVQLYRGGLVSVSDLVLFSGANAAAVQRADGAWEVLQFANAQIVGTNTYKLSRLLRGQAGSEWAMADPLPAGAPFVVLDGNVAPLVSGLNALGRPLQLRIGAANLSYGDAAAVAQTVTPGATALWPLSPVHLRAARDGSGVTFTWVRRTRIDGDSWDVQDVPLGEASEAYEADIFDGASVVRTLSTSRPQVLYAAADEIADFGAPQPSLTIAVYQISASVGRGIAARAVLTP
jgi:hypothetical protein